MFTFCIAVSDFQSFNHLFLHMNTNNENNIQIIRLPNFVYFFIDSFFSSSSKRDESTKKAYGKIIHIIWSVLERWDHDNRIYEGQTPNTSHVHKCVLYTHRLHTWPGIPASSRQHLSNCKRNNNCNPSLKCSQSNFIVFMEIMRACPFIVDVVFVLFFNTWISGAIVTKFLY